MERNIPAVARAPKANRKNKPAWRSRFGMRLLLWLALIGFLGVGALCVTYAIWASTFDLEAVKEMPSRSTVYDMDGKMYSRLQGENRVVVPLGKVSRNFIEALLAREDARFYQHRGVDPIGILRAIVRNLISGSAVQGASTITQQLARNSYPDRISGQRKNAHRKLLEAFVALRIEQHYTKDEILENYVNRIYFGAGDLRGIESASLAYFNQHASDLSLSEAALLAGIVRGPGFYSPAKHPERAIGARDAILDRMVKLGQINEQQAGAAKAAHLEPTRKRPLAAQQSYAMAAVERDLHLLLNEGQLADGGLKIYTTLDPALQSAAEKAVDAELRKVENRAGYAHPKRADFSQEDRESGKTRYLQGAAIVIDNRSGAIRAVVGGRDYSESNYNRAITTERQVGSTFKPFVYASAFRRGMLPGMLIDDGPIARGEIREAPSWAPGNSDGTFKGIQHAEEGLILSRNTMSVRVGEFAGLDEIAKTATATGIMDLPRRPSVFLGAFETSLAQLTTAYSVFPNNGLHRQSYVIERIDDAAGDVLFRAPHVQAPAIDAGVTWLITGILSKVMERGTAAAARTLGWTRPAAGKTGTTNDYKDAWFVGYTSSLTCGVWVGLDQPEPIIPHGYGAALALPIWVDVMNAASSQRYPAGAFKPPVPLSRASICAVSNEIATTGCERAGNAYTADLPETLIPHDACHVHRGGVLANTDHPPENAPRRSVPESVFRSFKRFFGGD